MAMPLILASGSPRRRELIDSMGIPFQVIVADAEEVKAGNPQELVMENARRKAAAVAKSHPGRIVLGADTMVFAAGEALGKPRDDQDARRMLRLLSGGTHWVYTGVSVMQDERQDTRWDATKVFFSPLTEAQIDRYIASGEPWDKAGAYAIQGKAGMFVERIEGSYSNVIGLPLALVREMLLGFGAENL